MFVKKKLLQNKIVHLGIFEWRDQIWQEINKLISSLEISVFMVHG